MTVTVLFFLDKRKTTRDKRGLLTIPSARDVRLETNLIITFDSRNFWNGQMEVYFHFTKVHSKIQ
jgi:hypothetical protein